MFKLGIKRFLLTIGHLLLFIVDRLISFTHVMSSQCFFFFEIYFEPTANSHTAECEAQKKERKKSNERKKMIYINIFCGRC